LGFDVSNDFKAKYPKVQFIYQKFESVVSEITDKYCLQHGAFMDVLDFVNDNDIIIFSDGDVIIQRDINESEINLLETFTDNDIGCNMNNFKARSLESDYNLLQPLVPYSEIKKAFGFIHNFKEFIGYNTGLLIGKPKAWRYLRKAYKRYYPYIEKTCLHYAKQQLLINIITQSEMKTIEVPQTIHTHGHFGLPPFARYDNGLLKVGDELVLFRHFL
jgi:hypothetical protein